MLQCNANAIRCRYEPTAVMNSPVLCLLAVNNYVLSSHQVLEDDITAHKPAVENVNQSATTLIQNSEPKVAKVLQTKLNNVNSRYDKV